MHLGGKEFKVGKKGNNIIGINGKLLFAGGNRYTPIDIEASIEEGYTVRFEDRRFEARTDPYFRVDLGSKLQDKHCKDDTYHYGGYTKCNQSPECVSRSLLQQ